MNYRKPTKREQSQAAKGELILRHVLQYLVDTYGNGVTYGPKLLTECDPAIYKAYCKVEALRTYLLPISCGYAIREEL